MAKAVQETDSEPIYIDGPLSRLIREKFGTGQTYHSMGTKARDPETGTALSFQYIWKIAQTPPVKPPSVSQMRALAAGLGVPYRRVQEATAAQWLDYAPTSFLDDYGPDIRAIVQLLGELPDRDVRRFRAMVEAYGEAVRDEL